MRMLAHRIADRRVLRLIERWLKAGILESGQWQSTEVGTPQGSGISPILANLFLHYVVDLWVHQWRQRQANGQIVIVRYADDMVIGCQDEDDARKLLAALTERLSQFGLAIHEGKTRLIAFGRRVARRRELAGMRRPETFDFLGFTHYCDKTRSGRFTVKKKTQAKRMVRKLKTLRSEMKERLHLPVREQHQWLCQVLKGHYGYYGVIFNYRSMERFRHLVANCGSMHCGGKVRGQSEPGNGSSSFWRSFPCRSRSSTNAGSVHEHDRGIPVGRAHCGKAARWDLWGRKPAMA